MARTFNGSSDRITTALGNSSFAFGNGTMVAIVYVNAYGAANSFFFTIGTASGAQYGMGYDLSGLLLGTWNGTVVSATPAIGPITKLSTGKWYLVAWTKTLGTTSPTYLFYDLITGVTKSSAIAATVGDSTSSATNGIIARGVGASTFHNGDIEAIGVWNSVLTQDQILSMAFDFSAWYNFAAPVVFWRFDQGNVAQLVRDETGGAADQTAISGTTVSANSCPWSPGQLAGISVT